MTLQDACQILADFSGVPLTFLETNEQRTNFCEKYQFHDFQEYLMPDALDALLAGLEPGELLSVRDVFHVRFVFFLANSVPMAAGPYCTEFFVKKDCGALLEQLELPRSLVRDFGVYRGAFPVLAEREVLHMLWCLAKNVGLELHVDHAHHVEYDRTDLEEYLAHKVKKTYTDLVQERYQIEEEFMENIRQGDRISAIESWRKLHNSVAFLKDLGQTMESARVAAAIFRTTIRVVAMDVGIPATVNDDISGESADIVRQANTVEEIDREHERIIRKYCRVIHEYRNKQYSGMVLSAIYCIERQYGKELTVSAIAKELGVTPNHLITCFRKETGITPNAYLCRIRMKKAAKLLAASTDAIQDISAQVGILDANYFAKLFKREYGETPASYRRAHKV